MDFYSFNLDKHNLRTRVSVPINGLSTYLYFTFRYNQIGDYWTLTVSDSNMVELISEMPLLYGEDKAQNLLRQFKHLGIGSAYIVKLVDVPKTDSPDFDNWLKEFDLWWGSESA